MTRVLRGKTARIAGVLTAAGSGSRLGHAVPKALVELVPGHPETSLLALAASRLAAVENMRAIVVTAPQGLEDKFSEVLTPLELSVPWQVVAGSVTRQASVASGLAALTKMASSNASYFDAALVHDAARALAPTVMMDRVVAAVLEGRNAVIPALAVTDTIKVVAEQPSGAVVVIGATERETLRAVQTPQGFAWPTLLKAHGHAAHLANEESTAATDDSSMAQWIGEQVYVVDGSEQAVKITTESDLQLARTLLHAEGSIHTEETA